MSRAKTPLTLCGGAVRALAGLWATHSTQLVISGIKSTHFLKLISTVKVSTNSTITVSSFLNTATSECCTPLTFVVAGLQQFLDHTVRAFCLFAAAGLTSMARPNPRAGTTSSGSLSSRSPPLRPPLLHRPRTCPFSSNPTLRLVSKHTKALAVFQVRVQHTLTWSMLRQCSSTPRRIQSGEQVPCHPWGALLCSRQYPHLHWRTVVLAKAAMGWAEPLVGTGWLLQVPPLLPNSTTIVG